MNYNKLSFLICVFFAKLSRFTRIDDTQQIYETELQKKPFHFPMNILQTICV